MTYWGTSLLNGLILGHHMIESIKQTLIREFAQVLQVIIFCMYESFP